MGGDSNTTLTVGTDAANNARAPFNFSRDVGLSSPALALDDVEWTFHVFVEHIDTILPVRIRRHFYFFTLLILYHLHPPLKPSMINNLNPS